MKRKLDKILGADVRPWHLHDIRRSITTALNEAGVPEAVADRILNHSASGSASSTVSRVYNTADILPERASLHALLDYALFMDSQYCVYLVINDMCKTLPNLADLPFDVQAYIAAQTAKLAAKDADILGLNLTHAAVQKRLKSKMETTQAALVEERTAHSLVIQNRDMIIADLRMQLDGHKKHRFGSRSESLDQLALELVLEEHEIAQAAETVDEDAAPASKEAKPPRTPRARKPFPKDLERVETRIMPSDACLSYHLLYR